MPQTNEHIPMITEIRFIPMRKQGSLVGFVSFIYDGNIAIKDVAVHQRAATKDFYLLYPENGVAKRSVVYPINQQTQKLIELEVNSYIKAQGLIKE